MSWHRRALRRTLCLVSAAVLIASGVVLAWGPGASAAACTPIVATTDITLTSDMDGCTGTAILIAADGITVNGDDYYVTGNGTTSMAPGVAAVDFNGHSNVIVEFVRIDDFDTGIEMAARSETAGGVSTANVNLTGNEVASNTIDEVNTGIALVAESGDASASNTSGQASINDTLILGNWIDAESVALSLTARSGDASSGGQTGEAGFDSMTIDGNPLYADVTSLDFDVTSGDVTGSGTTGNAVFNGSHFTVLHIGGGYDLGESTVDTVGIGGGTTIGDPGTSGTAGDARISGNLWDLNTTDPYAGQWAAKLDGRVCGNTFVDNHFEGRFTITATTPIGTCAPNVFIENQFDTGPVTLGPPPVLINKKNTFENDTLTLLGATGSVVQKTPFYDMTGSAITVNGGSGNVVSGNTIELASGNGVNVVGGAASTKVEKNKIVGAGVSQDGVNLGSASGSSVQKNKFVNTGGCGVDSSGDPTATVQKNKDDGPGDPCL